MKGKANFVGILAAVEGNKKGRRYILQPFLMRREIGDGYCICNFRPV